MAVCAVDLVGIIEADRDRPSGDIVVFCLVAICTQEIVFTHVDVNIGGGEIQGLIQIAMFNRVSTAAIEVAAAAVFPGGSGNAAGNIQQIHSLYRITSVSFYIGTSIVMAHQAVNLLFLAEIEIGILPSVACVAGCAAGPVPLDPDAKIIDRILLSYRNRAISAVECCKADFPRSSELYP